jgi:hypothetical protein
MKELATDLKQNRSHQNLKDGKHIVRFPRLPRRFPRLPVFLKLGQLVHHLHFGCGTISNIRGCNVTVAFCDEDRELDFEQVVTRVLAEERWQDCHSQGANRRLEEGLWLWHVWCLCSRRGEWTAFLKKWDMPRSSAQDLIQRFRQERFPFCVSTSQEGAARPRESGRCLVTHFGRTWGRLGFAFPTLD